MTKCVVIADDLTGANAAGVLMAKNNYKTVTVMNIDEFDEHARSECDCVICPTDSRSIEAAMAYRKVFNAAQRLREGGVKVYSKRIDTTLRGNLGAETDALLDALGDNRTAMIVPCFPSSNRINVGGCLLVNGVPLHKTAVAVDPKNPVHTPYCAEIISAQSKYPLGSILIRDLMYGLEFVVEKIRELAESGVRNILFDAVNEEDINLIAEAVVASSVPFIAVDPGVFTAALVHVLVPVQRQEPRRQTRILAAVGSVNQVARTQVDYFLASLDVCNVYMETAEFLEDDKRRRAEIMRVTNEIINNCDNYSICSIIGRGIIPEYRVPFEPYAQKYQCSFDALSRRINESIAEIVDCIIRFDKNFHGIYTCGGDITVAVCKRINSAGLKLFDEVLPLAAYGEIIGGSHDGLKVVTKGGMVGDADAIVSCIRYLAEKISVQRDKNEPPRRRAEGVV
ncbi:MAG: four-carbon acid sugar kinase family protein [Spirochaetaceae bacterium]|jgi:uncharacterized protein YgbK (DUF1537 family)|nr:four-carbon acid sugar kinase family protein [Spirochaetaceae bacterium]